MSEVVLHIYDVTNSGLEKNNNTIVQINRFFKDGIGLGGIFHSAIQVYGDHEWSFVYCEQGTGVFSCPSGKNPMYTYREKIVLGRTDCTIFMVNQIMRELSRQWPGKKYDLLSKNCNHFCNLLCDRLGVPKIPDKAIIWECTESMTNTGSVDIKTTIDTGLPWKTAVKGSRSLTRRTKKQVARAATSDIEAEYKSSAGTTAAKVESESEKLHVSVLGQHFTDRVEYVPIKKRRFIVPSPSHLDRSSACSEGSQHHAEVNHALPVSRLNPNLMGLKTAEVTNDKPDCSSHDFSGIKILAEVACSSGMSSDIASVVESQPVEPVQQQNALTLSTHVEGNDSSTGTVDVSGKDTTIEYSDKVGEGKSEIIVPQKVLVDQSEEHSIVACSGMIVDRNISIAVSNESSTERPKENMEVGDSVVPQSETVTVSGHLSDDERTGKCKISECLTDDRLHWDLNLPTDAWGQPCDVVDASRRYSDGEVTESGKESGHVDGSKDYTAGLIVSDVHVNSSSPSGPKVETSARNEECQSGYDSQFEDGEWREPYPWAENEGDSEDVEQVDYGSEPENEQFYSLADSNENKLDVEKGILAEKKCGAVKSDSGNVHEGSSDTEKHVVVCMNDSHSKGSSPSRSFGSRPFKPSHETIPRRRPGCYEELSEWNAGPSKFVGRDRSGMRMRSRSPVKGRFGSWDSKRRFSPPIYKGGPYGFGRPRPKTVVEGRDMMNDFDQPGPDPGPQGYVRRQFSNRGYRGRFRRLPDGSGYRDFRGVDRPVPSGDGNEYRSRMHNNRMKGRRERSNSPPVFSRLHDPQSRSRSRSRSPGSWNRRNRSPPGFRGDESKMERVRCPFPKRFPLEKRFPLDQEVGFISPPRNQRNSRFFDGRNNDGAGGENHQNNLRGRTSAPGRMFRPEQRFDSMRRVNSESNHFRPFMRHNNNNNNNRRFVDGGGSRGGRCKYEAAEEETNGNRYEMVHRPPRRLVAVEEDGDNIKGFRLNEEQQHCCFQQ